MNLLDALEILKSPVVEPISTLEIFLGCGFTPLHLKTFLTAHLRLRFPAYHIQIASGVYGDLAGSLERTQPSGRSLVCVVIEWADLDPRLGVRGLGKWLPTDIPDIANSARLQSVRLSHILSKLAEDTPICVAMPSLPLPPMFTTRGDQAHHTECQLREVVAALAGALSGVGRVRLLNFQRLDEISPLSRRFDVKAEITSGFPYTLDHASHLAELLAALIQDSPPKKGLITDLDDTLWAGILGEDGIEGISWDMERHSHGHALYQRFLASLAGSGVLLGVASKNDRLLAEQALGRPDLLLSNDSIFPLEIHWGPKSESVQRILQTWNIKPHDVVFVDDSPMEVAEVHSAFPEMDCILFPKGNYQAIFELLKRLRDSFGKSSVTAEDEIRLSSIRAASMLPIPSTERGISSEEFLRDAKATITFFVGTGVRDTRAFELINKTNQFNLNGKRFTESEWLNFFRDPAAFILTASYQDKYGPLGKISVVVGKVSGRVLFVNSWVMSCRAFSRRIEYQCLKFLLEKFHADEIIFDYQATPRNGPLTDLFAELLDAPPTPGFSLRKTHFNLRVPATFHQILEVAHV